MKLVRSSFYYKPRDKGAEHMKAEADLRDKIEAICLEFPRYGYRRVTHQLKYEGCLLWIRGNWLELLQRIHSTEQDHLS